MGDEACTSANLLRGKACHFRLPSLKPELERAVTDGKDSTKDTPSTLFRYQLNSFIYFI